MEGGSVAQEARRTARVSTVLARVMTALRELSGHHRRQAAATRTTRVTHGVLRHRVLRHGTPASSVEDSSVRHVCASAGCLFRPRPKQDACREGPGTSCAGRVAPWDAWSPVVLQDHLERPAVPRFGGALRATRVTAGSKTTRL